ncbi:hypothetical protein GCM10017562_73670 [Streptomyces roseofulvus]|uniref:Regulatory protein n=2 Tax=Streptomyces TaxID=1883 RepID=A0ABU4KFZ4_9ACTN|nr:hypothetical protein [Streptomyces roseolus]MDX2296683.1 hypothetical protein [Streptomyces roseolus]
MVIMRPAIPSETVKLDPIDVSSPMGRISVVTMEKIPAVTERTASQESRGERSGGTEVEEREEVVAADMSPVLNGASQGGR